MKNNSGGHVWYELMTTDRESAEAFYRTVLGWDLVDSGMPGIGYTLAQVGGSCIGGLMGMPKEACDSGQQPCWFGYIAVPDVDAYAAKVTEAGGAVHRPPCDIPTVGRFAIVADPQGAVFVLFKGDGTPPEPLPYMTPGTVGWHELHAHDWEQVYPFYERLFGWPKDQAMEMGPMGKYQLLGSGGVDFGAMFTDGETPRPYWLYYFSVADLDAARTRVAEAGGTVTNGPHEVPGQMWIVHVSDPQGARFALVGPRPGASASAA